MVENEWDVEYCGRGELRVLRGLNGVVKLIKCHSKELPDPFYFTCNKICGFMHMPSMPTNTMLSVLVFLSQPHLHAQWTDNSKQVGAFECRLQDIPLARLVRFCQDRCATVVYH